MSFVVVSMLQHCRFLNVLISTISTGIRAHITCVGLVELAFPGRASSELRTSRCLHDWYLLDSQIFVAAAVLSDVIPLKVTTLSFSQGVLRFDVTCSFGFVSNHFQKTRVAYLEQARLSQAFAAHIASLKKPLRHTKIVNPSRSRQGIRAQWLLGESIDGIVSERRSRRFC